MSEKCPQKIIIMADYSADSYAWDFETGELITPISDYFLNNSQIIELEQDLSKWCEWFDQEIDPFEDNSSFPWKEFHAEGLMLARKLANILSKEGIEIYYQIPYEDPGSKDSEPQRVEV